jgi:hypothetical protein
MTVQIDGQRRERHTQLATAAGNKARSWPAQECPDGLPAGRG